jgi:uncharacterized protein
MFNLLPKDAKFYDELEQLSDRVVSTAKQFESIVASFPKFDSSTISSKIVSARRLFGRLKINFRSAGLNEVAGATD